MPDPQESLHEGRQAERLGVLGRALEAYEQAARASDDPAIVAEALVRQADVHRARCDWDEALRCAREAQEVARAAGLDERRAEALNAECLVYMAQGELDAARPIAEQLVATTSDIRLRGIALQNLGTIMAQRGDLEGAERAFGESYGCFVSCGYERGQVIALNNQGRAALDRGDLPHAEQLLADALESAREVDDSELIALAMVNYAEAIIPRDDVRAESLACSALGHFQGSRNTWRTVECLRLLGSLHERRGAGGEAARCYERALTLAKEIGARVEIATLEQCLARVSSLPETR